MYFASDVLANLGVKKHVLKGEIIILSNYDGKNEGVVKIATGLAVADPRKYSQTEERALADA